MSHAKYPPSKLRSLEICVGFENEDSKDNMFAEEGTKLHKACETENLDGLDDEQKQIVQQCLDYVSSLRTSDEVKIRKEVRLNVANLTFGTADVLLERGTQSHLVDYKFGRNSVDDASENIQGWCYAAGVFHENPQTELVVVHFLLPRRNEISSHSFKREELGTLLLRIGTIIERRKVWEADQNKVQLNPVPENCNYCARKGTCFKMHEIALKIAPKYDVTFELPEEYHASQITDPKQMALAQAAAVVMEKWAKSVKEHATQMALHGIEIPGWEISSRAGRREIQSVQAAYDVAKELIPTLTESQMLEWCSISITEFEKGLSALIPRGKKGETTQLLRDRMSDRGITTQAGTVNFLTRSKE